MVTSSKSGSDVSLVRLGARRKEAVVLVLALACGAPLNEPGLRIE